MSRKRRAGVLAGLVAWAGALVVASAQATPPVDGTVTLPPGFALRVFAEGVQDARFLTYSPQGDLYVGQLLGGNSAITILPDRNHDGRADRALRVATDLNSPNNVTFRRGVTATVFAAGAFDQLKIYTDTHGDLSFADSAVLVPSLPLLPGQRHKTKTVAYGPDGRLYVSVGSVADDPPSADPASGIYRYQPDGSGRHLFATHLRNTVGFDWDPVDGAFWGADNGSDDLGTDRPHDELNLLVDGGDYGWPYCVDNRVPNDKTAPYDCAVTRAPTLLLAAHAGALGTTFYTGGSFPARYWGGLFVAYHSVQFTEQRGVWFIPFQDGRPAGAPELFAQRTAPDGTTTNRFLGLAVNPYDGSLMISDDREGKIYQVVYTGPAAADPPPGPQPPPPAGPARSPGPPPIPAPALPGLSRTFPLTGHSLSGPFLLTWFWNGGQDRFGAPISDPLTETLGDGTSYRVQYTARARFEYHPERRGTTGEVQVSGARYADRYGAGPDTSTPAVTVPSAATAGPATPAGASTNPALVLVAATPATSPAVTAPPASPTPQPSASGAGSALPLLLGALAAALALIGTFFWLRQRPR